MHVNRPRNIVEYERKFNETDKIPVFNLRDPLPSYYSIISEIHVTTRDYKINEVCSYEAALDKFILKSLSIGGDAVKIIEIKKPGMNNVCWGIKGLSLKYDM